MKRYTVQVSALDVDGTPTRYTVEFGENRTKACSFAEGCLWPSDTPRASMMLTETDTETGATRDIGKSEATQIVESLVPHRAMKTRRWNR